MVGKTIAHYEVLDEIGAGGMGVVYKAWDKRLERQAAIKALPEELAEDADRLARFEREAKLLAGLKNPHIATVYGFEEVEGRRFLAMELVEGKTLAERLAQGPLAVREGLELARQVAEALEEAHAADVIHRDVKPGNIMIGADGKAKVLDFGLAKTLRTSTSEADPGLSPTLTQPMTRTGHVLGTPVYMSPEQVAGKEAGKQSDIWAFGCVLYEMLTGKRPFPGPIVGDAEVEPDWKALPRATPSAVRRLLRRCLAADPRRRLRDIGDAALDLADAHSQDPDDHGAGTVRPTPVGRSLQLLGALVVGLALGAILVPRFGSLAEPPAIALQPAVRGVVELPDEANLAYGTALIGFDAPMLTLSPDGRWLVYVGRDGSGSRLYRHDLTGFEGAQPIGGTEEAIYAFFAPDGSTVGFFTNDRLKRVSLFGDGLQTLAAVRTPTRAVWLFDDTIVFGEHEGTRIGSLPAGGGEKEQGPTLLGTLSDVLPDGRRILVSSWDRGVSSDWGDILLLDLESGREETLIERGYDARYLPTGHLLFARAGSLLAVGFDLASGKVSGEPVTVVSDVGTDSMFDQSQIAVAASGTLAYVPGGERALGRLGWVDRAGGTGLLEADPRLYGVLDLDPEDRRLAVHVGDVTDYIWIFDLDRREGRILQGSRPGGWPSWSSSGRLLAFVRDNEEADTVSVMFSDMTRTAGPVEWVELDSIQASPGGWTPDDSALGLVDWSEMRIGVHQVGSGGLAGGDVEWIRGWGSTFSPDGQWLAYGSDETGVWEIYVRSWPAGDVVRQISTTGGIEPRWCPCGELFYRAGDVFWSVEIQTDPELVWHSPKVAFETDFIDTPGVSFDISSDGNRLYVVKQATPDITDRIYIVSNWFDEVNRLVPAN